MQPRPTNGGRRPVSHGCRMLSRHFVHSWRLAFYTFPGEIAELNKFTILVHNWLRSMAGAAIGRFRMVTSLPLEVQGPGSPYPFLPGASNCLGMFGVYSGIVFQKLCIFYFPEFSILNKHIFGNMTMFWFFFDPHFHTKQLPVWRRAVHNSLVPFYHP